MIDTAEAMSRRVFLTAVCAPPTESFFLNFYDVMLSDFRLILCADVYVLYDYSYISVPPLIAALPHTCFLYLAILSSLKYPCLILAGWLVVVVVVMIVPPTTPLRRWITWPQ